MRSRIALCLLVLMAACGERRAQPHTPLARAAEFLWKQQSADGGWHSRTYGLLRSGQSLTPFVLDALLQVPPDEYTIPKGGADRALSFLRSQTGMDGALGMADPAIPDYPNYSTALAVRDGVHAPS